MATSFQVRAYSVFLTVLGKDRPNNQSISHDQLLGGVAYYLTALPQPYIRSFATLTVSSAALWGRTPRSSSFQQVHRSAFGIRQAVRQAVVAKYKALKDDPNLSSILPALGRKRVSLALTEWLDLVVSGSQPRTGSKDFAIPRLAFLSGLVLGLKELENQGVTVPQHNISRSCAELVVGVAECLDLYAPSDSDPIPAWDSSLALSIREAEVHLDIVVELCAAVLHLVPSDQATALDLSKLACVCAGSVLHLFQNGFCFKLLESELVKSDSNHLVFKPDARFPQYIEALHNSPVYIHLGSIAKLIGHLCVCMTQSDFWQPRSYPILTSLVDGFGQASLNLEMTWSKCPLSQVKEDTEIAPKIQPVTTQVWHMLKSILFTTVLASQSILDVIIYYSAVTPREGKLLSKGVLMTFCRLSFVSTKFGALTSEGGGFSEMKRAFFGALDVLAFNYDDKDTTGDQSCANLVIDLSSELTSLGHFLDSYHPIWKGRVVYFLVCTEHVISQLSEQVIVDVVLPIVQRHVEPERSLAFANIVLIRHLSDIHNREVYEAAHSVMLAIFAAHENQHPLVADRLRLQRTHLLVPAYIDILLRNSEEERLSTDQLRLAFQALVRSASIYNPELGWFCVEKLADTLKQLTSRGSAEKQEQILRLQLALISAIPAVSTSKLLPMLNIVYDQITTNSAGRGTLSEAAYREIVERLGDREKDIALRWWMSIKSDVGVI